MSLARSRGQWRILVASVAGLLGAVAVASLVSLLITLNARGITDRAVRYDVALEDVGDDLRVAVLDVRHFHRNILFAGPSRIGLADFEAANGRLLEAIDDLGELEIDDPGIPAAAELRRMAQEYHDALRPAIDVYTTDRGAFLTASDAGLVRLRALESVAQVIDKLGEQRATAALTSVDAAAGTATVVLVAVLAALGLASLALGYAGLNVAGELRRLAAAHEEAAVRLADALRAKNDFIADASHELRTPLTVLRGNAEVGLAMDPNGPHSEALRDIVSEAERMTRLVESLLLLARSDTARLELERESLSIEPWLVELGARADVLAREGGAQLESRLTARGRAHVDPVRLQQALLALVDNAVKHGRAGGHVTFSARTLGDRLIVEVEDDGPGIPAPNLPRIFDRFYRVDKARARARGGAGLGLAIARTLVEAHGGRIDAKSTVGLGTTMTVSLPLIGSEPDLVSKGTSA